MANKVIPKKASAPMDYNKAIRVDNLPVNGSEALITSGGVQQAFKDYEAWQRNTTLLDASSMNLGYFRVVANKKSLNYGIDFDSNGDPIRIYSMDNSDFDMEVHWW